MELIQKTKENLQAAVQNRLLSPQEAAAMLGVTVGTLQIWRTTRRYPLSWVKAGRLVKYKIEDVQSFIDSRTVSPVEA